MRLKAIAIRIKAITRSVLVPVWLNNEEPTFWCEIKMSICDSYLVLDHRFKMRAGFKIIGQDLDPKQKAQTKQLDFPLVFPR